MVRRVRDRLHDGTGRIGQIVLLDGETIPGRTVNFVFENTLAPGVSIGAHDHAGGDEECYLILKGMAP